jgi:hypothetical protein
MCSSAGAWLRPERIKQLFQHVWLTVFFRHAAFARQKVVQLAGMVLVQVWDRGGAGKMKRRYLVWTVVSSVTGIFALSIVAPVAAADLNPVYKAPAIAPAFNWNGFYVGANVGGAWTSNTVPSPTSSVRFPV